MDQIEEIDLRDVKDRMKSVEDALHLLQEEVSHMEAEHLQGNDGYAAKITCQTANV